MANDSVVNLANKLLQRLDISYRLSSAEQCDSTLFIDTFSQIVPRLGGEWPENAADSMAVARRSRHESQSRIQLILDTLLAMLSTDLSHINARAVVDGDLVARTYLLEIFMWVLDYLDEVSRKLAVARGTGVPAADDSATRTLLSTPSLSFTSLSSDSSQSFEIPTTRLRERRRSSRRSKMRNGGALDTAAAAAAAAPVRPPAPPTRTGPPLDVGSGSSSCGSLYSVSDLAEADISSAESRDGRRPSERRGPHQVLSAADISISSIASDTSRGSLQQHSSATGNPSASQHEHSARRQRHHRQWDAGVVAGAPSGRRREKSADRPPSSAMHDQGLGSPPRVPAQPVEPVSSTPKKPAIARRIDTSLSTTNTSGSSQFASGRQMAAAAALTAATLPPANARVQLPPTAADAHTSRDVRSSSSSHPTASHAPSAPVTVQYTSQAGVAAAAAAAADGHVPTAAATTAGHRSSAHRHATARHAGDMYVPSTAPPRALHTHDIAAAAAPLQFASVDSSSAGLPPGRYHGAVSALRRPPPTAGLHGYGDADGSRGGESSTGSTTELLRDLPTTGTSASASIDTTELLVDSQEFAPETGRARSKPQPRHTARGVPTATDYTNRHTAPGAVEGNSRAAVATTTTAAAVADRNTRNPAAHPHHATLSTARARSTLAPATTTAATAAVALPRSAASTVPVATTTVLNGAPSASYPHAVSAMFTSAFGATTCRPPALGSVSVTTAATATANHHQHRQHRTHTADPSASSLVSTGGPHVDSSDSVRPRATDSAPSCGGRADGKRDRSDASRSASKTRSSGREASSRQPAPAVSTSSRAAATAAASRHSGAVTTRRVDRLADEQRSTRGALRKPSASTATAAAAVGSSLRRQRATSPVSHPGRRSAKPSDDALLKSPLRPTTTGGRRVVRPDSDGRRVVRPGSEAEELDSEAEFSGSGYSDAESPPPRSPPTHHTRRHQPGRPSPPRPLRLSAAGTRMRELDTGYRKELSRFRRRTRSMTAASAQASAAATPGKTTTTTAAARKSSAKPGAEYGLDGRRLARKPSRLSAASSGRRPSTAAAQSLRGKSAQTSKRTPSRRRSATATSAVAAARRRRSTSPLSESHETTDQQSADEEDCGPVAMTAGILPVMADRFPHLQVSRQTAQRITQQHNRQMRSIVNQRLDDKTAPNQPAKLIAEAELRQAQVVNLLKKEIAHNQRLQDQRDTAARQREVAARLREKRHASARAHRYYNDFELKLRSKLSKQRNAEELIFRKLFEDGLALQRSRIRELRSYAKEKGKEYATKLQDDIDSMENYYRDQFSMLAEVMDKERNDEAVRQTEQAKAVDRLKRELRKKMEADITRLQEALDHGEEQDAAYVRQLEADRLRHDMHMLPGPMPL